MTVTLRPSEEQRTRWETAAYQLDQRTIPSFVRFAADFTARYVREQRRLARPDRVTFRMGEKKLLGSLLEAARVGIEYIPREVNSPIHGRLNVWKDLREAIRAVDQWLGDHGEEWE